MQAEGMTKEQFEQIADNLEAEAPFQGPDIAEGLFGNTHLIPVPAGVHLEDGRIFESLEFGSWGITAMGIVATGRFKDDPESVERHILLPFERVLWVELFLEAYEAQSAIVQDLAANDFADEIAAQHTDTAESVQSDRMADESGQS